MTNFAALHTHEASVVFEYDPDKGVFWRHCGARVDADQPPSWQEVRGPASFALDNDVGMPVAPPAGLGWFGPAVVGLVTGDGATITFAPQSFKVAQASDRLTIQSVDDVAGVRHELLIETLPGGAFRFGTTLTNLGGESVCIHSLSSAQVPLPADCAEIISWRGRHNAELHECREAMPAHRWERITRRGISGHGGPPGVYVLGGASGWHSGLTYALQLAWSGDSMLAIERDDEGYWHLCAEAKLAPGEIVLGPGETYRAPTAILAISTAGRNGAMAQHHAALRSMLQWPGGAMAPRRVHLNSWEACYFNHDAARITQLARAGAAIGVERFVLDDGWFNGRRDDTAGLGDWVPDGVTYPDGLVPLAETIRQMGMEFGLWVEPEMVNPDSDLYRDHPDWALSEPGRQRPTARKQLVLDMRREDVRDYLFDCLDKLLTQNPISYLKWDHNRDHAPWAGAAQTRGTYSLLERVRAAHPDVEIEGCAGGGGRSDAGLVPYVHRFWTSDNIDAVARVGMQRGFLAFLPPEIMGSHVGASPAHATGRSQALAFRAAIACTGHFGVELDPDSLDETDREELARWIAFYKQWRDLIHGSRVHMGQGADSLRWQAHGTDDRKLVFCIRTTPAQDRRPQPVPLPFAGEAKQWKVSLLELAEHREHGLPRAELFDRMGREPVNFSGSWLASAGLPLPVQKAESVAIFLLESTARLT
jgi:alpha-galactosidase